MGTDGKVDYTMISPEETPFQTAAAGLPKPNMTKWVYDGKKLVPVDLSLWHLDELRDV